MLFEINNRHKPAKPVVPTQAWFEGDFQRPSERLRSEQAGSFPSDRTQWTEEDVTEQIRVNDPFVYEVILLLQEQQTPSEQVNDRTIAKNGKGFSKAYAATFGRMAKRLQRDGKLTSADLAYCREPLYKGRPRLAIHREQILGLVQHQEPQPSDQRSSATPEVRQ
jgi:hypothetical protein